MDTLAQDLARRAYALNPTDLDATLNQIGLSNWQQLVENLRFVPWNTGGGCMLLTAELPGSRGYQVSVTDGELGLPMAADHGWLCILDPEGEEIYAASLEGGQLHVLTK